MLKCSRLRWVWASQYRLAGTSTSPRLSNSRRIPVASRPMGMSRIFGALSLVSVMMRSPPRSVLSSRHDWALLVHRLAAQLVEEHDGAGAALALVAAFLGRW